MEYQETSIGKIPADWNVTNLGDENIATLIMGQSPPSATYNKEKKGLPFLQGKAEFGDINPSPVLHCSEPMKVAKKDDILISVRAPVGDVNFANTEYCIGRGLAAIRSNKEKLNHVFLFNYIQMNKRKFEVISTGSTFKAIRKGELEQFKVPIPNIDEQKTIAKILSTVGHAIQKSDEIIVKAKSFKRGMMQKLLTEGIGHNEFRDTPLGKIPVTWEISPIKNLIKTYAGGTPLRSNKSYYKGNILWVKSGEVNQKRIYDTEEKITKEGYKNSSAKKVPKDSVLIAMYGATAGKVGILKCEGTTNQAVLALPPNEDKYFHEFIYYMISFNTNRLMGITQGTGQPNLSKQIIDRVKIALPPLEEQYKIATILSKIEELENAELERNLKLKNIKKGLMNDLLTGRKRVQVTN